MGFVAMVNAIIFLLLQVFLAEFITNLANQISGSVLIFLIIGGFLVATILAVIVSFVGSEYVNEKPKILVAALLAFLINSVLWFIISYICVLQRYPDILDSANGLEKIIVLPTVVKTFAIYILPDFTMLWLLAGITQVILYVILLKLFNANVKRQHKNTSGTFW